MSTTDPAANERTGKRRRRRRRKGSRGAANGASPSAASRTQQAPFTEDEIDARRRSVPELSYPSELPITQHVDEIKELLQTHQVVVIAGDTGSGKTTQIPKICLAAGFGVTGIIGHTQPRRLAARAVAARVADELNVKVSEQVGYAVRFSDQVSRTSLVKMMTDGILLTEIRHDRDLSAYDVLIIDEAHERSLNIDFLLGYLKALLRRRPELRLVITSATIDESAFAEHFNNAPVVRVSGRSYPVDVVYVDHTNDYTEQLEHCFAQIERKPNRLASDVLMFLAGEREILDTARQLRKMLGDRWDILPLYARLSAKEQSKIFTRGTKPRVVLATNVAETSLTVPNIGFVIDPGRARLSRYSFRSKLQRLPIEPISQASATQRSGRCGRIAPGVCFRLYSAEDFASRDAFTEPELRRSNLAAVVLQMRAFKLGDIRTFGFLNPPQPKAITDAERLLTELGALRGTAMSRIGAKMARLPVDPRLARMLVAAAELGSLAEVLIIVSALGSQDPRERPLDKQQAADTAHEMFADERSDFMVFLNIWRWAEQQRETLGSSALKKAFSKRYLSNVRMREWRSLHSQLRQACKSTGLKTAEAPASYSGIHQALITGSLSLLGLHDERGTYLGARGSKFQIFPGSHQHKRNPKWVIAAEIAETSRVYARGVAGVSPQWLERASRHLQKRSHSEPSWNPERGEAMIYERVVLYGLTLSERRPVRLAPIDAALARELFLRDGLLRGGVRNPPEFMQHNLSSVRRVLDLEARGRRRDLLAADEELMAFYDERLPAEIVSAKALLAWVRKADVATLEALRMSEADLYRTEARADSEDSFPGRLSIAGVELRLTYRFAPGEKDDGLNVQVPLGVLAGIVADPFDWLVPGMLATKVEAMVRTLPKRIRRKLAPVPDHVNEVMPVLRSAAVYRRTRLTTAVADALNQAFGVTINPVDWDLARLEPHLLANFQVRGKRNKLIGQGRTLDAVQTRLLERRFDNGVEARAQHEASGLQAFPNQGVPALKHLKGAGEQLVYPALRDDGDSVSLVMCAEASTARAHNRTGYPRLARLADPASARYLLKLLRSNKRLGLYYAAFGTSKQLEDRVLNHLYWNKFFASSDLPQRAEEFTARIQQGRAELVRFYQDYEVHLNEALSQRFQLVQTLESMTSPAYRSAVNDVTQQLADLFPPEYPQGCEWARFGATPGYLRGVAYRLEHLQGRVDKDERSIAKVQDAQGRLSAIAQALGSASRQGVSEQELDELWVALEEWRMALFAQPLALHNGMSDKKFSKRLVDAEVRMGLR